MSELDYNVELFHWLKNVYPTAEYSSATVEFRTAQQISFQDDDVASHMGEKGIIVRSQAVKDRKVYFANHSVSSFDLIKALRGAEKHLFETNIYLSGKELFTPVEGRDLINGQYSNFDRWIIDPEIAEDLRIASSVGERFPSEIEATTIQRRYFFSDSNNISSQYEANHFSVELEIIMEAGKTLHRKIGFNPSGEDQLAKVYRLIPYTVDLIPMQGLRSSKSFEELAMEMDGYAYWIKKNGVKLTPGLHDVVTPMTTFMHEVCHQFETSIPLKPANPTSILTGDVTFTDNDELCDKWINFRDNPRMKLKGLPLIATRPIDLEGFRCLPQKHIENGFSKMGSQLGSLFSDGGVNGRAIVYDMSSTLKPRITVSETFFNKDGPRNLEELCEEASSSSNSRRPILVCDKIMGHSDLYNGIFNLGGTDVDEYENNPDVFIYEQGLFIPIKSPHLISGTIDHALKHLSLANKETLTYNTHSCGRLDPFTLEWDIAPSSQVGPLGILRELTVKTLRKIPRYKRI